MLLCATGVVGCYNPSPDPTLATASYPMELHKAISVPIQVIRDEQHIEIINSTAVDYENTVLWINQRFSAPIPPMPAGSSIRFNLWNLNDAYGEQLHAGGFWRTNRPTPIVIAELQLSEDTPLVGLIVINGE